MEFIHRRQHISFGEKIHIGDVLLGFGVRGIIERAELDYFGAMDSNVL
jgi:hypothetical protein